MTYFKKRFADRFGVKSAIIVQYLFDNIYISNTCPVKQLRGKTWVRCSKPHLISVFPFYSRHQISDALDILVDKKVIKKTRMNESPFDHTNWYAFTEYGLSLMTQND